MKELFTAFLVETMSTKPGPTGMKYVKAVRQWMEVSKDIVADMRAGLKAVSETGHISANAITKLFCEFVSVEVTSWLDEIAVGNEPDKTDRLAGSVMRWAKKKHPEAAQREIAELLAQAVGMPTVWVRSAAPIDMKMRSVMRTEMQGKYLVFNVDQNLLGGMKLLSEGKVLDASWLTRINKLDQLVA